MRLHSLLSSFLLASTSPNQPLPRHQRYIFFGISASKMPGIRTAHKKALRALEPIANLLCQSHRHEMSIIDPASGGIVEGYSLTIECGGDSIIWMVKMGENCRFRSLMRAREVIVHNSKFTHTSLWDTPSNRYHNADIGNPNMDSEILFQIDSVWRGQVCDELLRLHSIRKLKKNWWNYPVILSNDQHTRYVSPSANFLFLFLLSYINVIDNPRNEKAVTSIIYPLTRIHILEPEILILSTKSPKELFTLSAAHLILDSLLISLPKSPVPLLARLILRVRTRMTSMTIDMRLGVKARVKMRKLIRTKMRTGVMRGMKMRMRAKIKTGLNGRVRGDSGVMARTH